MLPNLANKNAALSAGEKNVLRKRVFAPAWWCEGILLKHASFDCYPVDVSNVLAEYSGRVKFQKQNDEDPLSKFCLQGSNFTPKQFLLLYQIWHELVTQSIEGQSFKKSIRVSLGQFLKGTSSEIAKSIEFLASYWSSPFQLVPLSKNSKKQNQKELKKSCFAGKRNTLVNFVRYASIEYQESKELPNSIPTHGPMLLLDLNVTLCEFVAGHFYAVLPSQVRDEFLTQKAKSSGSYYGLETRLVVSANPDVIRAFGTGTSFKKLASYLFVELAKTKETFSFEDSLAWQGCSLSLQKAISFHQGLLQRTKALYDHGLFGWDNDAPPLRVKDIIAKNAKHFSGSQTRCANGLQDQDSLKFVHCWRLSAQAHCASAIEAALSDKLLEGENEKPRTVEASQHESSLTSKEKQPLLLLDNYRVAKAKEKNNPPEKVHSARKAKNRQTPREQVLPKQHNDSPTATLLPVTQNAETANQKENAFLGFSLSENHPDREISLCILEYYTSLSPRAQTLFQKQHARMSTEEFRAFIEPILKQFNKGYKNGKK